MPRWTFPMRYATVRAFSIPILIGKDNRYFRSPIIAHVASRKFLIGPDDFPTSVVKLPMRAAPMRHERRDAAMPAGLDTRSGSTTKDRRDSLLEQSVKPRRIDRERAISAVRDLLVAAGTDPDDPRLARTPQRAADALIAMFSGIGVDAATGLGTPVAFDESDGAGELIALTGIQFSSICEHHLLPFAGTVDVYYAPRRLVAGLSRIATAVDIVARRPQMQERLGVDIAKAIMSTLEPYGVVVKIRATHGCVAHLEPRAATASAVTIATLGTLPEPSSRMLSASDMS